MTTAEHQTGRFIRRLNRFVAEVEINGKTADAYLPNTSRLLGLLIPNARLLLVKNERPNRKQRYTITRIWSGDVMVSIEANRAGPVFQRWIEDTAITPFGRLVRVKREVAVEGKRIDFYLENTEGAAWYVEVKSLSPGQAPEAWLSGTPSTRAWEHLEVLGNLAEGGWPAACVFILQRPDVNRLAEGPITDPGWSQALRRAKQRGVQILAYSCDVTEADVRVRGVVELDLMPHERSSNK